MTAAVASLPSLEASDPSNSMEKAESDRPPIRGNQLEALTPSASHLMKLILILRLITVTNIH